MPATHLIAYFFGGAFLTNAIPHFVAGVMGSPFQTPFAKPPGKGLSSCNVNVAWGFFNLVAAFFLLVRIGHFNLRHTPDAIAFGVGVLVMGFVCAHAFGPLHGGANPTEQK
jgi:hypothetical protein